MDKKMFYRHGALVLLALAVLWSCCLRRNELFDPSEAVLISDNADLMAHCSAFLVAGDSIYFSYYHDTVQSFENPGRVTIAPVLASAEYPSLKNFRRIEAAHAGDTLGEFVQADWRAPYDPNMLLLGEEIFYYFIGCSDSTVTYCVRKYDLRSGRFAEEAVPCTLTYDGITVPLDSRSVYEMFRHLGFPAVFNNDVVMSAPFVEYEGEYYNSFGSAFLKRSCPVVVKTVNGIDFDLVMLCPDFLYGCCESSVAIWGDNLYVIMRNSGVERGARGTYLAKYSMKGELLAGPVYLSEAQSKPVLTLDHGRLYAIYNANPSLQTDWGLVSRSRLRVSRIGRNCEILQSRDITDPYGIHYPYTGKIDGETYISFTEDRAQIDINQTRSNISFSRLWK